MSEENKEELLEWYHGNLSDYDLVISNMRNKRGGLGAGDGSGPYKGPCGKGLGRDVDEPSTADMSQTPPESPQNDIQREIEKKDKEQEQPTTADEVVQNDKKKMYKAFGMVEVLENKLKELYSMTDAYQNEPQKREQLASDVKQISADIVDLLSEL